MVLRSRFLMIVSILLLCSMLVPSAAAAQGGSLSPGEFRDRFAVYMAWLDSHTSQNMNLAGKVQGFNEEEVQSLYNSFEDPDGFIAISEQVMNSTFPSPSAAAPNALAAPSLAPMLFAPDYPNGSVYEVWVATLPGLGLLSDGNGDGSLVDDRCSYDGEAGIAIASGPLNAAAIVGDVACNSIVVILGEGTNLPACIVAGVLHEAVLANDIVDSQCAYQDGSVNGAEIEAAYENSKIISSQVGDVSLQLTDISVQIEGVSNQIKDVSTQLATHDTEVKAILQANHTETINLINANQAQALKIEIEKALADTNDNKRLSYFYLPQSQGGLLELVRQTVQEAIDANLAAGIPVGNAQSWFTKANASFASGQYKAAYDLYGKAYIELVK